MKNILHLLIISIWSTFVTSGQTSSATLTLGCPAAAVPAGNDFLVGNTITSSHYTGNVTVLLNFDNTKVNFVNIPSTYAVTNNGITTVGSTSTLSVTVPITGATGGQNQGAYFAVKFRSICPQTCFGQNISANFTGSISAATIPSVTALPCTTNIKVENTWSGTHVKPNSTAYYNCVTNRVKFNIRIFGSSCHELHDAKVTIMPSIASAALVSTSMGTFLGNTISLGILTRYSSTSFDYELELPCTVAPGTVLTVNAVLAGKNCGNDNPNILTTPFPSAQFTIPNASNTQIYASTYVIAGVAGINFPNSGSTPMNITNTTTFPAVQVTSANFTLPVGTTASMTFYDCSNNPITTVTSFPYTLTALATKATYTISNLQPGQTAALTFNYVTSSACTSPPITTGIVFSTLGSYTGFIDPLTAHCNCVAGSGDIVTNSIYNVPTVPPPYTNIVCLSVSQSNSGCKRAGDVLNYCLNFRNQGTKDLANAVLKIPVSPNLTFNLASLKFNGIPITGTIVGGELVITLPGIIPFTGALTQSLCFDATVNATASEGIAYSQPYSISGTDYPVKSLNCAYMLTVCSDPKAIVVKEVYDTENAVWAQSGSGLAGVPTRYRITIKNIGNVDLTNVVFLDRTPEPGDNFVTSQSGACNPRNSQFKMMPTGVFTPAHAAIYENSAVGTNKIPSSFISSNLTSCDVTSTAFSSTLANTVRIDIPTMIPAFGQYTFEMGVDVPANANASERACNTASISYDYKMQDGSTGYGGVLESDSVCYTVLPPPCNNCPGLAGTSSFVLTPGTTSSAAKPYLTKSGMVTIKTLKPVQEIRISIADLQYGWNKAGCTDCKLPAIARGGLFPLALPQNIGTGGANGYLNFYDFTGNGNPATVTPDNCPEELIWKLGVMLQPGTYTIPIQLTLPKPQIEDCCTLELGKFDVKVTLKDAECKVCDFILPPSDEDCCTGGAWVSKTIAAPPIRMDRLEETAQHKLSNQELTIEEKELKTAWKYNALISNGVIIANPIPKGNTPVSIDCASTEPIRLTEGATRIFAAQYKCNASMKDCNGTVLVSIKGNGINVVNQPNTVSQVFSQAGEYTVTYTPTCGGKPCGEPCRFKVLVEKNCCLGYTWNTRTYQAINKYPTPAGPVTQIPDFQAGAIRTVSSSLAVRINLGYTCASGCASSYLIRTITNGVSQDVTLTGAQSSFLIYPGPVSKRIIIYGMCGGKTCGGLPLIFNVACDGVCREVSPNSIQVHPVDDGMLDGRKALLDDAELQRILKPLTSAGSTYQLAQIEKQNGMHILVAQYADEKTGSIETISIPLSNENGYLRLSGIPIRTRIVQGKTTMTQLPAVTSKKSDYVGHVTLMK